MSKTKRHAGPRKILKQIRRDFVDYSSISAPQLIREAHRILGVLHQHDGWMRDMADLGLADVRDALFALLRLHEAQK